MRGHGLLNIPNLLSLSRLALTVPMAYLIAVDSLGGDRILFGLIAIAAVTDILDGYLARRLDQRSELGRVLDPVCDKIMIAVLVACLVWFRDFPALLFIGLLLRDGLIAVLGVIHSRREGRVVEANAWGKANTVAFAVTGLAFLAGLRGAGFDALVAVCYTTLAVSGIVYYTRTENAINPNTLTKIGLRGLIGVLFIGLIALALQRAVTLLTFFW